MLAQTESIWDRWFDFRGAFEHPVTVAVTSIVFAELLIAPVLITVASRRASEEHRRELWLRYKSWLVIAPLIIVPILIGGLTTMLAICGLGLLCYREYARATGLFRETGVSVTVVAGIILVTFASIDHWPALFAAVGPLTIVAIAAVALMKDEPRGYIQRVALASFGMLMFGVGLGHLSMTANDVQYRPLLLTLFLAVEVNDVFAFCCGKLFGKRKLAPNTSPNKTLAGSLGAIILTTGLIFTLGYWGMTGREEESLLTWYHMLAMGVIISVGGQLGDLMLSSIKRDLGLKDIGAAIPGHGGLLDRFDSILLVAPAIFHYIQYFLQRQLGESQPQRVLTDSFGW